MGVDYYCNKPQERVVEVELLKRVTLIISESVCFGDLVSVFVCFCVLIFISIVAIIVFGYILRHLPLLLLLLYTF